MPSNSVLIVIIAAMLVICAVAIKMIPRPISEQSRPIPDFALWSPDGPVIEETW